MMLQENYRASLAKISPEAMYAYLHVQGWEKVEPYGEKADFFTLGRDGPSLLVPASVTLSDYTVRLRQILDTLSEMEERSSLEILRDLSLADFDRVRVGNAEARDDDLISFDEGLGVMQESRSLLRASAYSAISPRPVFLTRGTRKSLTISEK